MPRKISKPNKTSKKIANASAAKDASYMERIENEIDSNQSKVSMVLGALIVLVIGILIFNYFSKSKSSLGPAQQTESSQQQDVSPSALPGKYTVKEGDTLFSIADKYYQDGYKYTEIAKVNNLENPDSIETGQVVEIPDLKTQQAQTEVSPEPSSSPDATVSPEPSASPEAGVQSTEVLGTGGGDSTIWGPRINGNTYTVEEGDWLSKIAGRAYGDIESFNKIAAANNIADPNVIEPGTTLTIPR